MELLENNWGKVRCPHCDSVMQNIESHDIFIGDDGHYIICPVCQRPIWFNDKYEPNHIVQNALTHGGIPHR